MVRRLLVLCLLGACNGPGSDVDDTDVVDPGELVGILVTPESPVLPAGGETQLTATGLFGDRTTTDLTAVVDWVVSGSAVEVSDGLDEEGLLRAVGVGEAVVSAQMEGVVSPDIHVKVTDAELLGVSVDPKEVTVAQGDTVQLTCTSAWSDGSRGDATGQVRWVTGNGDIVTMDAGGILTGVGLGRAEVHAEWETTASNDVAVEVIEPSDERANLEIGEVSIEAGGGYAFVTVRVLNTGGNGAEGYWVDLFVDPTSPPSVGDYGDEYVQVDYTGPRGGNVILPFTIPLDDGSHEIAIVVDSADDVDEEDEDDNVWSDVFEAGAGAVGPNLTITYFDWIADDASIYYAVDVYNAGSEDAPEFYIDLYRDRSTAPTAGTDGDEYVTVNGLAAGDTTFADFLLDRSCFSCTSWLFIDSYDQVDETNEDDNLAGPVEVGDDGGWDTGYY